MRWKKGETFKKMPPLAMIQSITVEYTKGCLAPAQLVNLSMYAGMRRDNQRIPPGQFYFYMDFDNNPSGLHIYPTPEKQLNVRVRYLPKVQEI